MLYSSCPLFFRIIFSHPGILPGLLCALVATATPAGAATVVGEVEIAQNQVTGELPGARRALAVSDTVHLDEIVSTAPDASTRLRFSDRSDLRLGAGARIRLNAALFKAPGGSALRLTRGAMQFFSGDGPRGSYEVRTPVGTIGLRGTGVSVVIRRGLTYVTLLEGEARVCTNGGACQELVTPCDYVVMGRAASPPRPSSAATPVFANVCEGDACGPPICQGGRLNGVLNFDPVNPNAGGAGGGEGSSGSSSGGGGIGPGPGGGAGGGV
jgi:hypothetical protein